MEYKKFGFLFTLCLCLSFTYASAQTPGPTVTIDSVVPNPTAGGTTVTWHADENGSFVARVGGTSCTTGTSVDSGTYSSEPATHSTVIAAGSLAEGANTIRVCVTDAAGNNGSVTVSITKDTTTPTSAVSTPANGDTLTTPLTTISGTASDGTGSGVQKVELSIKRNSDGLYWDGVVFASASEIFNLASGTTAWSLSGLTFTADGSYTARSRATDNAGNVATPGSGNTFTLRTHLTPKTIGTANSTSGSTSIAVTLSSSVGIGASVVVTIAMDPSTATVTLSDTAGNSYTNDSDVTNGSGISGVRTMIFSAPVTSALVSGNTITADFNGSLVVAKAVSAFSVSGLVSASRVDKTSTAVDLSSSPNSGTTATTSQPDELLIGALGIEGSPGFNSFGSGFQLVPSGSVQAGSSLRILPTYRIATTTGTFSASASISISALWASAIVTYKMDFPKVSSIARANPSPTSAGTVNFNVTFSESVFGLDLGDFALAPSGISGASIMSVTGSGTAYLVTASTGTGDGTLGLNLVDNDTIRDVDNLPLGGTGTTTPSGGNGSFTGEVYTIDKTAPTIINCGPTQSASANGSCQTTVPDFTAGVSANDGTGSGIASMAQSPTAGTTVGVGLISVTVTVTDNAGNSSQCLNTFSVSDTTPPSITGFPADQTVSCASQVTAANNSLVTATDNCAGTVTITHDADIISSQTCPNRYTITRTYHAIDVTGNVTSQSQIITVNATALPDITKGSIPSCFKTLAEADSAALAATTGTGGCGDALNFSVSDNGQTCPATITVTGTDPCNNSSSAIYTATILATAPFLSGCPTPSVLVHCAAEIPAVTVTARDACNRALAVEFSETNPGNTCTNVITRTWTATDCMSNVSSCSQTITLHQDIAPTVNTGPIAACYPSLAAADAAALAATTGTGGCGDALNFSVSDNGQSCPATITVTGTDACSNSSSVTYTATILTTAPVLSGCPDPSVLVHCAADIPAAATVTARDACNTSLTVTPSETQSNPAGCTNVITRTWTATDCAGNVSSCSQTITLNQDAAPTVNTGPIAACYQSLAAADAAALAATTGTGGCGDALNFSVSDNGQSCPATITVTGTDACSNSSSVTYTATILTTTPVLSGCPDPSVLVHCAADIPAAPTVTARDGCNTSLTVTPSETQSNPAGCTNVITRTWTATDCAGNVSSCSQTITLQQDTAPVILGCPANLTFYTGPGRTTCDQVATWAAPTASGGCGSATMTQTKGLPNASTFPIGQTAVEYTAVDACGNTAKCAFTVTVTDNTKPIVICKDIAVHLDGTGQCSITASDVDGGCSDNCTPGSGLSLSIDQSTFNCSNVGNNAVVLTATDGSGNTNSGNAIVTVVDDAAPHIACPPDMMVTDGGAAQAPVIYPAPTTSDNCAVTNVTCVPASGSNFPVGTTTVTCTATDSSGNTAACYFTVTRSSGCQLSFNGFMAPVGGSDETGGTCANSVRNFKLDSTIPLKFILTCGGVPVATGVHTLAATRCSGSTDTNAPITVIATDAATTGNQFRLASASNGEWHFNLDTKSGFGQGTWKLTATLSDGSQHFVYVGLKK